jgi:hypothetical protein
MSKITRCASKINLKDIIKSMLGEGMRENERYKL